MTRQYPPELHIGQRVLVHPAPASHAVEALVEYVDVIKGLVTVAPIGFNVRWIARPRAIMTSRGWYLHFEDRGFIFKKTPNFS